MPPDDRELALRVLAEPLSIVRLGPDVRTPDWLADASWYSVTRTAAELSVVCASRLVPRDVPRAGPWRALQVEGPLDFALTGILSRLASALAGAGISIFAVSTYDTDYVLVRAEALDRALSCLRRVGIVVRSPD